MANSPAHTQDAESINSLPQAQLIREIWNFHFDFESGFGYVTQAGLTWHPSALERLQALPPHPWDSLLSSDFFPLQRKLSEFLTPIPSAGDKDAVTLGNALAVVPKVPQRRHVVQQLCAHADTRHRN